MSERARTANRGSLFFVFVFVFVDDRSREKTRLDPPLFDASFLVPTLQMPPRLQMCFARGVGDKNAYGSVVFFDGGKKGSALEIEIVSMKEKKLTAALS